MQNLPEGWEENRAGLQFTKRSFTDELEAQLCKNNWGRWDLHMMGIFKTFDTPMEAIMYAELID